jgi:DnaJ-domain-containing protein 1
VDGFIDRLADFIKSLRGDDPSPRQKGPSGGGSRRFVDPDLQDAWNELDDFMRTGKNEEKRQGSRTAPPPRRPPDESLRRDYANLEVAFGADIETVRKGYKRLIMKYHPDKFGNDAEKQRTALEITKKINESFERIRARHES